MYRLWHDYAKGSGGKFRNGADSSLVAASLLATLACEGLHSVVSQHVMVFKALVPTHWFCMRRNTQKGRLPPVAASYPGWQQMMLHVIAG